MAPTDGSNEDPGFADLQDLILQVHQPGLEDTASGTESPSGCSKPSPNTSIDHREASEILGFAYQRHPKPHMVTASQDDFYNPFLEVPRDLAHDPSSLHFSAKAWLTNLHGFTSMNPSRYPQTHLGVSFRNLNVFGFSSPTDYQKTVGNISLELANICRWMVGTNKKKIQILQEFDGLARSGEMVLVLGRPGSGCSTLLKTLACEMDGLEVGTNSKINYQGISPEQMLSQFRGEAMYMAETDVHFPQLTVGQTLLFAAKARAPPDFTFPRVTRDKYAEHMANVIMATFGLSHIRNTAVGNDIVKGVSGGERKRVSIAEAVLSRSPLQFWDHSTRGLDSVNALEFCKHLQLQTKISGATAFVTLYQGSQAAYDIFDKVTLLYEGRQIYFGPCDNAKPFFTKMGFVCKPRQTTADFLTSLTSPAERLIIPGYEDRTPRTAEEFAEAWKSSSEYSNLMRDILEYEGRHLFGGQPSRNFISARHAQQAPNQRSGSPYTSSLTQQVSLCVGRGFLLLKGDSAVTVSRIVANTIMALVVGSVFYNLRDDASSFYSRSVLIFFAILLNAFASALEILLLYAQRPIVEKQARYAFYHPFAEAISSAICDMPFKVANCLTFNMTLYFMTDLRRTPSAFFIFLLFSFATTLTLSMVYRTIGASSRSLVQALCPSSIFTLGLMIYTGFVVPSPYMVPWFRWIQYIDPIAYAFESLMINEFHGRDFKCVEFVPDGPEYAHVSGLHHVCNTVGAAAGSSVVSGTEYIRLTYNYDPKHLWRNFGIILALMTFFTCTYLLASELIRSKKPKGEVLLFKRKSSSSSVTRHDVETSRAQWSGINGDSLIPEVTNKLGKQKSTFQWRDICCDIKIKKEDRRVLDRVDGWVKPGTLTALMGPSGAGKTTLLDVLATRDSVGIASGEALVDGRPRDVSFQRKTGYAQQQDIHLETMTIREALRFNAVLCQTGRSRSEKVGYAEEIICLLGMESFADAVIGVPGEGLNVEQRKKLTIAVELAARPELLLFLDEPSSGLDSQTAWSALDLLEMLTSHGQAILCTIHQPSAALFQRFNRLLLLAPEGKPVYFGEIGESSKTVINYFERNGARPCPPDANPAEWLMGILGCIPGSRTDIDWPSVWRSSPELVQVYRELDEMKTNRLPWNSTINESDKDINQNEFAASFHVQIFECFKRVNQQYWRTPSYIYSKAGLCLLSALFVGFSFYNADNTMQGIQNQTFSIFMLITQASNFIPQILPNFVTQRSLYEARERPAKTYSWQVFMLANILIELPWNTLMAAFIFVGWYFPVGFWRNAETVGEMNSRAVMVFLLLWTFLMWASTLASMMQAGVELAEMAGNYANVLVIFSLIFCGLLVPPRALPGFWIFMYRISPFTYLVNGLLSSTLYNAPIHCSAIELLHFKPYPNMTCGDYMAPYTSRMGGYLLDVTTTNDCAFCPVENADAFLDWAGVKYELRWWDLGILWVYVLVNVGAAVGIYWLVRVPKRGKCAGGRQNEEKAAAKSSCKFWKPCKAGQARIW